MNQSAAAKPAIEMRTATATSGRRPFGRSEDATSSLVIGDSEVSLEVVFIWVTLEKNRPNMLASLSDWDPYPEVGAEGPKPNVGNESLNTGDHRRPKVTYAPPVLSRRLLLPLSRIDQRVATATLVVGFALLTAACAQIRIDLGFTPVPITGQTFAVLLSGAVLGSRFGATSQLVYVALGAVGLPFYAGGTGGWAAATGATAGYLLGFIVAAYVVGYLAENHQDRRFSTSVGAFLTGNLIIYVLGTAWLMYHLSWDLATGVEKGMAPFIIGDTLKILLAGGAMPTAWKLVGDR